MVKECKCAQEKMGFPKENVIRSEIWEMQSIKYQQLSSKTLEIKSSESTVIYSISSVYYQLYYKRTNLSRKTTKLTTVYCISIPAKTYSKISRNNKSENIKKNVFRILQDPEYSKRKFMRNSKFKTSQRLIKRSTSSYLLVSSVI